MKTTLLVGCFILLSCLGLQAKGRLNMQIQTKEPLVMPISLVKVCLYQGDKALSCAISDANGKLSLNDVPSSGAGYRIEVQHIGYQTYIFHDWKGIDYNKTATITLERKEGVAQLPYVPGVTPRLFGKIYAEDTEAPLKNIKLSLYLAGGTVVEQYSHTDGSYRFSAAGQYDSLRISDANKGYFESKLIKAPLKDEYGTDLPVFMRSSGKSLLRIKVVEKGTGTIGENIPVEAELDRKTRAKGLTNSNGQVDLELAPYYYYLKIPGTELSERVQVASGEQDYKLELDTASFRQLDKASTFSLYLEHSFKSPSGVTVELKQEGKVLEKVSDVQPSSLRYNLKRGKYQVQVTHAEDIFVADFFVSYAGRKFLALAWKAGKWEELSPEEFEQRMRVEIERDRVESESSMLREDVVTYSSAHYGSPPVSARRPKGRPAPNRKRTLGGRVGGLNRRAPVESTANESYAALQENAYRDVKDEPLSTFSIDVDNASYSNIRRYVTSYQNIPKDAVRIEEMLNYFDYDYPEAKGKHPFSVYTEVATCPWNEKRQLVHIGLQGEKMNPNRVPSNNLVFLLDVSGSMSSPNKLPLLQKAFNLLVDQLDDKDKVSIVVYAGASGLVLPATSGDQKQVIKDALNKLSAGGSTAGGAGINLAYKIAEEQFIEKGNNRIILATDGDFNVGASNPGGLERLIEKKRDKGIFLTVLGLGMGNYKDDNLERLADKGNGNYAYLDNLREAYKFFVQELNSNLYTIAQDVKLQIEFNPNYVQSYRLIGYENRLLNNEDFNDDTKDAGELGAGHTVTAIYEIIPADSKESKPGAKVDKLKYQKSETTRAADSGELMTVKFRYKEPRGKESKLISHTVKAGAKDWRESSDNFRFSAAVAEFGMLLRDSEYKGEASMQQVVQLAQGALGEDLFGYRAQFAQLVDVYNWQLAQK